MTQEAQLQKMVTEGDFAGAAALQKEMAKSLGADSLRYLPVKAIAQAVQFSADQLCQACITGKYPTDWGQQLYQIAASSEGNSGQRTYEGISQMVRSQRA